MRTSFTLLLLALSSQAFAQDPVAAELRIASTELQTELEVGDVATLTVTVHHPMGTQVVVEDPPNSRKAQLIDQKSEVSEENGALKTVVSLRYGFFQPGDVTLPSFEIKTEGQKPSSIRTGDLTRTIRSVLQDTDVLSGPEPPVPVWVDDYTVLYGAAGLALLFLGGGAFWYTRKRQPDEANAPPPRPPHEVALEALLALEAEKLLERGDYMVFYVRLSEVLREYLGHRYGFPGTELTTTEICVRLADVTWPPGMDLPELRAILGSADLVKFGGKVPNVDDTRTLLRRAVTVVELTRPRVEPTTAPATETAPDDTATPDNLMPNAPSAEKRWMPPGGRT